MKYRVEGGVLLSEKKRIASWREIRRISSRLSSLFLVRPSVAIGRSFLPEIISSFVWLVKERKKGRSLRSSNSGELFHAAPLLTRIKKKGQSLRHQIRSTD